MSATSACKCEACGEFPGIKINYAPGKQVWMAHPECAARHFQALATAAGEALERIAGNHYRDASPHDVSTAKAALSALRALDAAAKLGEKT